MKDLRSPLFFIFLFVLKHSSFSQTATIDVLNEDGTINVAKTFCQGQKNIARVSVTGGTPPFIFKWFDSNKKDVSDKSNSALTQNLIEGGTYNVVIKGSNPDTIFSSNVEITVNPLPIIQNINSIISDDNISIIVQTNSNSTNSFNWTSPSGTTLTPISATKFIYLLNGAKISDLGTYKIKVTSSNNCSIEQDIKVPTEAKKETKPVFGLDTEEEDNKSFDYFFTRDCAIYQCDVLGNLLSNQIIPLPKISSNYPRFTVLDEKDDYVIIKFWRWSAIKDIDLKLKYNEKNGIPIYFRISKQDLLTKTRKHFNIWFKKGASHITAGTLIIPVKLRFNQFDFSKDVTLGPFVGWRTRLHNSSQSFISIGFNVGITSVTLNEGNAMKEDKTKIEKSVDLAAFTWSYGAILEFNKVQIGIFSGYDNISENSGYKWNYQNRPWISVGLGYSILSRNGNAKKESGGSN